MTVNLDVLMYLARIALVIAGVIAIVYLVLLFKSLISTMSVLQETLKAVNRDLVKLESPLDTVGQISNTVDEVQASAKKAAISAIDVFHTGTQKLGDMMKKKDEPAQSESLGNEVQAVKADFEQIQKNTSAIEKEATEFEDGVIPAQKENGEK